MPLNVGTLDISTLKAVRFQSVAEFGMDRIVPVIRADLAAHNAIMLEMLSLMAEPTTDRQRIYGTSARTEMYEVDEYGRAPTQKQVTGATVGFPLKMFQYAVGWTRKWMELHTPAEMVEQVIHAQNAHARAVRKELQRSIFLSTNYTFQDFLVDKVDLAVKRLVNADSAGIPDGPNGETFDGSTHTHYNAEASLTAANVLLSIEDLVEHGHGGSVKLAISRTNEAAFRALTGFVPYTDPRLIYRATDTPGVSLDITRLDNRAIGIFGAGEVWVKPWAIANYIFIWDAAAAEKTVALRQRAVQSMQGLRLAAEIDTFPLLSQYMEAEYGLGVWARTNGVVHYFANATYADPTIT